jgi:predicted aldo/keto reductase-like oxidoreductase
MPSADQPVNRRHFLERTSTAALGAALAAHASEASAKPAPGDMRYRRFGKTNLMISEVGLGCATGLKSRMLGPDAFNRYREELPAILNKLLDLGGNFVATGRGYHDTEQILGAAMKGRRQEVFIFTAPDPPRDNVPTIMQCCEESLRHFQTDCLDCYFSHGRWSEAFYEAALKLRQQGKIRFIGLSGHVPAEHRACVEAGKLDFVFQPYNYMALAKWTERFDRNDVEGLFAFCKKQDVGVICMKPMTGHFVPNWAKDTANPLVSRLLDELKQSGAEHLYQAMLLWVLKNPNVACAAVGMSTVQDAIEDCAAVSKRLTRRHQALLEQYAAAATGDYCRMCETCLSSCPAGIRIPDVLRYRMYYKNYGHCADARELYAAVPPARQVTACTGCGACQHACPNRLAIIEKLHEAHRLLA